MALPYINLYIGDVKKDTDLLSPEAFGGYMRLLFKLHEANPRGVVTYNLPQLCRIFAADTLDKNVAILNEIVTPAYNIFDYSTEGDLHTFVNRRMVRESNVSQARSEAGKKGATTTNSKNRQNKEVAEHFVASNLQASETAINAASSSANDSAKEWQNYNTNINNNSIEEKGGSGEKTGPHISAGDGVYVVPEMLSIFRKYRPKYIYRQASDFPALRSIAETIAKQEGVTIETQEGVERILFIWDEIVAFIQTDKLFKYYQLSQVEKYFPAICLKFSSGNAETGAAVTGSNPPVKPSPIQSNMSSANEAKLFIQTKMKGGENV